MIDGTSARASYRQSLERYGEPVTFRRPDGSLPDAVVLARLADYQPTELVGGILQGDSKVIALAEDFEAASWPAPRGGRAKDQIVLSDGRVLSVETVDDKTRKLGATLIAYEIQARG